MLVSRRLKSEKHGDDQMLGSKLLLLLVKTYSRSKVKLINTEDVVYIELFSLSMSNLKRSFYSHQACGHYMSIIFHSLHPIHVHCEAAAFTLHCGVGAVFQRPDLTRCIEVNQ